MTKLDDFYNYDQQIHLANIKATQDFRSNETTKQVASQLAEENNISIDQALTIMYEKPLTYHKELKISRLLWRLIGR